MAGVHRCNETEIEQLINGLRERIHLSQVHGRNFVVVQQIHVRGRVYVCERVRWNYERDIT